MSQGLGHDAEHSRERPCPLPGLLLFKRNTSKASVTEHKVRMYQMPRRKQGRRPEWSGKAFLRKCHLGRNMRLPGGGAKALMQHRAWQGFESEPEGKQLRRRLTSILGSGRSATTWSGLEKDPSPCWRGMHGSRHNSESQKQPRPETLVAWNGAKRWQVVKKTRQVPDPELSLTQNKAPIFKVEKKNCLCQYKMYDYV